MSDEKPNVALESDINVPKPLELKKNDVFKGITIVGTSNKSYSDAIEVAIKRAQKTLRELRWFRVVEQNGAVREGRIEYQVTLELFFKLQGDNMGEG